MWARRVCAPHRGLVVEGGRELGPRSRKQVLHAPRLSRDAVWLWLEPVLIGLYKWKRNPVQVKDLEH